MVSCISLCKIRAKFNKHILVCRSPIATMVLTARIMRVRCQFLDIATDCISMLCPSARHLIKLPQSTQLKNYQPRTHLKGACSVQ